MNEIIDTQNIVDVQDIPSFDEDNFDLIEHKKAAATKTQLKAQVKRSHRNAYLKPLLG